MSITSGVSTWCLRCLRLLESFLASSSPQSLHGLFWCLGYSESEVLRGKQLFYVREPCATTASDCSVSFCDVSMPLLCLVAPGCPRPRKPNTGSQGVEPVEPVETNVENEKLKSKQSWLKVWKWRLKVQEETAVAIIQGSEDLRSSGKCVPSPPRHLLNLLIYRYHTDIMISTVHWAFPQHGGYGAYDSAHGSFPVRIIESFAVIRFQYGGGFPVVGLLQCSSRHRIAIPHAASCDHHQGSLARAC